MPSDPHSRSNVWKAPDREIGKPGENRGKVSAHRDFQATATFNDRENCRTFNPACGLPMCNRFFRPRATGRMEFSAGLVLVLIRDTPRSR